MIGSRQLHRALLASLVTIMVVAPSPAVADKAADERARVLYNKGNTHFDLAEYDAAIAAFKDAYAISRRPGLLYNIAQAYRKQGNCVQALEFYRNYLRLEPDATNRAAVEKRIAEMQVCAKSPPVAPSEPTQPPPVLPSTNAAAVPIAAEPAPAAPATSVTSLAPHTTDARPTDAPPTDDSTANRGSWKRWTGLGLGGVGLATIGVGVVFSVRARQFEDEIAALCSESCSYEDERVVTADRDGKAASRNAVVSYVVGGAALSAGVALFIWSFADAGAETPRMVVTPTSGGAFASTSWTF